MKNSMTKDNKLNIVLAILVLLEIGSLIVFNIFKFKIAVNFDSSEYLVQVIQIWRQKTLLINDYYYSTMLTWDMPTLLAVVFYGVTGDVFLSYGLANSVLIVIFAVVFFRLCKDLEISLRGTLIALLSIFCVYDFGIINYIEELFINGALYGIRLLLVLLLADFQIRLHKNILKKYDYVIYVLTLLGVFISGISTGIFEAGCCILPVVLFELYDSTRTNDSFSLKLFSNKRCIYPSIAFITSLLGVVVNHLLGLKTSISEGKLLSHASDLGEKFKNNIEGIFHLFGLHDSDIELISARGIVQLAAIFMTFVVIFTFVIAVRSWCIRLRNNEKTSDYYFVGYAISAAIVNVILFTFVDISYSENTCEFRYWLIVFIYIFVLVGYAHDRLKNTLFRSTHSVLNIIIVACICVITLGQSYRMYTQPNRVELYEKIMGKAKEYNIENLFIYWDYFDARILATYVPDGMSAYAVNMNSIDEQGIGVINDKLRMPRWGTYVKYDGDCLEADDARSVGYVIDVSMGYDAEMLLKRATRAEQIDDSNIYVIQTDSNYLDFVQGFPVGEADRSRDYFNQGYVHENIILDDDGKYVTSPETISSMIYEGVAENTGVFDVKLSITGSANGRFQIDTINGIGETNSYRSTLNEEKTEINDIKLNAGDRYKILVETYNNQVALNYVDFYKRVELND